MKKIKQGLLLSATVTLMMLYLTSFTGKKNTNPSSSATHTAYIFLSETCPICQSVTLELQKLHSTYSAQGVEFIGIMPNTTISTVASIKKFKQKFNLPFELKLDEGSALTKQLVAIITPQVFVVKNDGNQILYSGKIDNSFERVGKRRTVVTEHYLQTALESILKGETPNPAITTPVGCFIVKNQNQ